MKKSQMRKKRKRTNTLFDYVLMYFCDMTMYIMCIFNLKGDNNVFSFSGINFKKCQNVVYCCGY